MHRHLSRRLLALVGALSLSGLAQTTAAQSGPSWAGQVVYQVMPDRFYDGDATNDAGVDRQNPGAWHGGDLKGLTDKLPYIRELGATALWLTPIYQQVPPVNGTAGYHGYWPEDFRVVDPHFGTLADFTALVKTAHEGGLKVMLDQVINHYGYGASAVSAHPDWFHSQADCQKAANKDQDCPLAGLPDLNQKNPEVVKLLNGNSDFWRNTGVDAFRYDAIKNVDQDFLAALAQKNRAEGLWTLGEYYGADAGTIAQYQKMGLSSVFDFALQAALQSAVMGGQGLDRIAVVLARDGEIPDPNNVAIFLDNHDLPRFAQGSLFEDEGRARTVYGLRALMTLRGVPVLWQGTEIAMRGGPDPDNRRDMRFPNVWTADEKAVFEAAKQAIGVRKSNPALSVGTTQLQGVPDSLSSNLLVFIRDGGGERVLVAFHNGDKRSTYSLKSSMAAMPLVKDLFLQKAGASVSGGYLHLSLPPRTAVAFKLP